MVERERVRVSWWGEQHHQRGRAYASTRSRSPRYTERCLLRSTSRAIALTIQNFPTSVQELSSELTVLTFKLSNQIEPFYLTNTAVIPTVTTVDMSILPPYYEQGELQLVVNEITYTRNSVYVSAWRTISKRDSQANQTASRLTYLRQWTRDGAPVAWQSLRRSTKLVGFKCLYPGTINQSGKLTHK